MTKWLQTRRQINVSEVIAVQEQNMTRFRIYQINGSKKQKWGEIIFSFTLNYDLIRVKHIL
jgi:hypothetical protein